MTDKKALGRGLGALIGDSRAALARAGAAGAGEGRLRELPLSEITVNRRQPRRSFATEELEELAASIRALGVVQPVVVRPLPPAADAGEAAGGPDGAQAPASGPPRFELIAGERRLRAASLAGLDSIPALVRPADEAASLEIALAENVAREDLNSIEEAQVYAALVDEFGVTHERVAELVGRSRVAVTNLLRLLELPDDVQRMIEQGELTEGHGRALLALPDHEQRRKTARLDGRSGSLGAADGGSGTQACDSRRRSSGPRARRRLHRPRRRALRCARDAGEHHERRAWGQHPDRLQEQG